MHTITLIYYGVVRLITVAVKAKSCFLISINGGNQILSLLSLLMSVSVMVYFVVNEV